MPRSMIILCEKLEFFILILFTQKLINKICISRYYVKLLCPIYSSYTDKVLLNQRRSSFSFESCEFHSWTWLCVCTIRNYFHIIWLIRDNRTHLCRMIIHTDITNLIRNFVLLYKRNVYVDISFCLTTFYKFENLTHAYKLIHKMIHNQ